MNDLGALAPGPLALGDIRRVRARRVRVGGRLGFLDFINFVADRRLARVHRATTAAALAVFLIAYQMFGVHCCVSLCATREMRG